MHNITNSFSYIQNDELPLHERFPIFIETLQQALLVEDEATLTYLIRHTYKLFLSRDFEMLLLQHLLQLEPFYTAKAKAQLAHLYTAIGNCLYMSLLFEDARNYYNKSNQHAFQYKLYDLIAYNMNHLIRSQKETISREIFLDLAFIPLTFLELSDNVSPKAKLKHTILYIDALVFNEQLDEADQHIQQCELLYEIVPYTRAYFQLAYLKALITLQRSYDDKAINCLYTLIREMIEYNMHSDLIHTALQTLRNFFSTHQHKSLPSPFKNFFINQRYIHFVQQKYLLNRQLEMQHYSKVIGLLQPQFFELTNKTIRASSTKTFNFVLIEFMTQEEVESFMDLCIEYMTSLAKQHYITCTRIDRSTICLFIAGKQEQCEQWVQQTIAELSSDDVYDPAIFFAIVNTESNRLYHSEKCLDLAKAFLYYEIYK